jgi:hypothetical protein
MRFRLWNFVFGLVVGSLFFASYNLISNNDQQFYVSSNSLSNARRIKCWIDGKHNLSCLADNTDVYMPFNRFIHKQFDVYGRVVDGESWYSIFRKTSL